MTSRKIQTVFQAIMAVAVFTSISQGEWVRYRPEFRDLMGNPVNAVKPGDEFMLHLFTQDIREEPAGVFAAYVDIFYDADLISAIGPIIHSSTYSAATFGDLSVDGLIDEAGGTDGISLLGGDEYEVFRVRMVADGGRGVATFGTDPVEDQVQRATLIYLFNDRVPEKEIEFGSVQLIIPEPRPWNLCLLGVIGMLLLRSRSL